MSKLLEMQIALMALQRTLINFQTAYCHKQVVAYKTGEFICPAVQSGWQLAYEIPKITYSLCNFIVKSSEILDMSPQVGNTSSFFRDFTGDSRVLLELLSVICVLFKLFSKLS